MKSSFALTFEQDIVALLYRYRGNKWRVAGSVPGNANNLHSELESLRNIAIQLAPSKFSVKLYAERSHVHFASFETDPGDAARITEEDILAMVAGKFGLDPDSHAFDWSAAGDRVLAAAISQEYLAEMEKFAAEHKFIPVCFAALSDWNEFNGEPLFGMTAYARNNLGSGMRIGRENEPPKILGASKSWKVA